MYLEPLYIALGLAIVSLSFALYRQELVLPNARKAA